MRDGETLVNIQITETPQIVAPQMNSQDTSSVSGKASLLADNVPKEKGEKNKGISPKTCIIISIWSALSACTIGLLIASWTVNKLKNSLIWDFKLWKWCLLFAIIICGGLGIFLLIEGVEWLIADFRPIEKVVHYFQKKVRKEKELHDFVIVKKGMVVYCFVSMKKSMVVFIWVTLIFISWFLLFDRETKLNKDTNKTVRDISRGIIGCIIGVAIWMVKTGLVKHIASYHVKNLFDKFESINHRCKILKSLSKKVDELKEEKADKEKKNLKSDQEKEKADCSFPNTDKEKKNPKPDSETENLEEEDDLIKVIRYKEPPRLYYGREEITNETEARSAADEIFKKLAGSKDNKGLRALFKDPEDIERYVNLKIIKKLLKNDEEERKHFEARAEDVKQIKQKGDEPDGPEDKEMYVNLEKIRELLEKGEKEWKDFAALAENIKQKGDERDGPKDKERYLNLEIIKMLLKNDKKEWEHFEAVAEDIELKCIKRSIFRAWVVNIFRQYESIKSAMTDKKSPVDELNTLASVVFLIVIIILWLLFMKLLSSRTLFFIGSQLVAVAFIFGDAVKSLFEDIIFVFVMHPFDVGDRCIVDGVEVIVDSMEITTTTFFKYDRAKIYYPNSVLATKPITNLYRSPPMQDTFEFTIDLSTSQESETKENSTSKESKLKAKLKEINDEIEEYIKRNPRYWDEHHSVQYEEIEDTDKLKAALYVTHKINFHDAERKSKRRTSLVIEMKEKFEKLKLKCTKFNVRYKADSEFK